MSEKIVHLPDLRPHNEGAANQRDVAGWFALRADQVSVPSLFDVQRCARQALGSPVDPCETHVVAFDPPNRTTIVRLPASGTLVITATITPSFPAEEEVASDCAPANAGALFRDRVPVLVIRSEIDGDTFEAHVAGTVADPLRQKLVFEWEVPSNIANGFADGLYALFVQGFEADGIVIVLLLDPEAEPAPTFSADPCAITLTPQASFAGLSGTVVPPDLPRPPLLAVDSSGCIVEAWSIDADGRVLIPSGDTQVLLAQSCQGGTIAVLEIPGETGPQIIRDAVFWLDRIAVLAGTEVHVFDKEGCAADPAVVVDDLQDAFALAVSAEGFLMVVQPDAPDRPNLRMFRRDGSEVLAPSTFDGRGFYARQRNAALFFDPVECVYLIAPRLAGQDCCASPTRPLTDQESLFFRIVDDLQGFRSRTAYPASGQAILGPELPEDTLDAGRPGTQWDRILFFGDIPAGCGLQVETRAADDILAGDPLVPTGWSIPTLATTGSAVAVASPGDTRGAAAAVMVLAGQGRFLWIRITLLSNGRATPRITSIELEHPRDGISVYLPRFIQNSTPDDDFLRRWLSLFENTTFDGVAQRLDEYAELFDPRTAPPEMLPFLAGWLQVLELARFQQDQAAFRFALSQAAELARTRGTIDGLILAVRIYMGIPVQIVESFKKGSGFVLGLGQTLDDITGPALGCQTILTAEPGPTWLGDAPTLGQTFLLDCERRFGTVPFQFEVLAAARDVCLSEDLALLQTIIETEKPAHTSFRIRQTGAAGWVVGTAVVGQSTKQTFDRNMLDPATFGILVQGGPPRPAPVGKGLVLGAGARLAGAGQKPGFRIDATLGRSTQL